MARKPPPSHRSRLPAKANASHWVNPIEAEVANTPHGKQSIPLSEPTGGPRLMRFPAVRSRTGLSRSTIWRLERAGAFPRHVRLSPNAVAWVEDEIVGWIRQKAGRTPP